ncbi:MAG: VCBS repeat-containing protein [Planctomycetes bacterium]|nr:VCBS repeat-containing protein [Planctomycetota bacterium]
MSLFGRSGRAAAGVVAGAALLAAGGVIALIVIRGGGAPRGEFLPRPAGFVTDFVKSEDAYDVANPAVKSTFVKGMKGRDWALAGSGLTDDFLGRFPEPSAGLAVPDQGMAIRSYPAAGLPDLGRDAFLAAIRAHVEGWASVERTTWRPFEFLLDPSGKSAYASVHFQVAGARPDGTRGDLTATVRVGLVAPDGKAWKIRRFEWVDGWRCDAPVGPWADITDLAGLTFNEGEEEHKLRQQMINDRGIVTLGGIVVADFNGDGFPDIFATRAYNEAVLFLNDGKGGFVRGESPVPAGPEVGHCYAFVDLDGDGLEELVSSHVLGYEGTKGWAAIYTRRGGKWELLPKTLEFAVPAGVRGVVVQGIVPHDVDGDGDLDLLFCNYSNNDSNSGSYNRVASYDGADNWLFVNQGGLRFTEESDARGLTGTQFSYVAKFWDFDADGDDDLFETNDFGPNHLWVNQGKGVYKEDQGHVFGADSNYTMGITIADWDNTGDWSMYISNMYSHAGNRIIPLAAEISPEMRRLGMVLAQGNQFYERKNGAWTETGTARGVNWADWAWGCVFADFDNDNDRDIFVANGYTTNDDPKAPDF